jgi:hypothetical protein
MAVAASEVVVGLGLIVAIARKRLDLDVDRLRVLRRMTAGAWLCLLAPLGGALLITLARRADSRPRAGYSRRSRSSRSFVAAIVAFVGLLGDSPETATTPRRSGAG